MLNLKKIFSFWHWFAKEETSIVVRKHVLSHAKDTKQDNEYQPTIEQLIVTLLHGEDNQFISKDYLQDSKIKKILVNKSLDQIYKSSLDEEHALEKKQENYLEDNDVKHFLENVNNGYRSQIDLTTVALSAKESSLKSNENANLASKKQMINYKQTPQEIAYKTSAFLGSLQTQIEKKDTLNFVSNIFTIPLTAYNFKIDTVNLNYIDNITTSSNHALSSTVLHHELTLQNMKGQNNHYLAKVTLSSDYSGNNFALNNLYLDYTRLTSLIALDNILLGINAQRTKSVLVDVLTKEFPNLNATEINSILFKFLQREKEGMQTICDQTALLRCNIEQLEYSKIYAVYLPKPCVYNLNNGVFVKYVYVLLISPNDTESVIKNLPIIIRKLETYTQNITINGIPTDIEEIWKDYADLDWQAFMKNKKLTKAA